MNLETIILYCRDMRLETLVQGYNIIHCTASLDRRSLTRNRLNLIVDCTLDHQVQERSRFPSDSAYLSNHALFTPGQISIMFLDRGFINPGELVIPSFAHKHTFLFHYSFDSVFKQCVQDVCTKCVSLQIGNNQSF